jgi:glutaredoxin
MSDPEQRPARVLLYSKPGCHLCDDARAAIERVCAAVGTSYAEIDITGDPTLLRTYGEQIPVTFVDGAQHDFWRVDEVRLTEALAR